MPKPTNNPVMTMSDFVANGFPDEPPPMGDFDPGQLGDDQDVSEDLAIQAAISQLGDDMDRSKVFVYRCNEITKKDAYLYQCSALEFAQSGPDDIQSRYGEGSYKVRVYRDGRVLTHRKMDIGPPLKQPEIEKPTGPSVAEMMAQQQAMFMAGMKEMIAQIAGNKPQGMGITETLQLITTLQPMFQPQQHREPDRDPFEMITKLLALQKELAPAAPITEDNAGTALAMEGIKTFGPLLRDMMATKGQQNAHNQITMAPVGQMPALVQMGQGEQNATAERAAPVSSLAAPIQNGQGTNSFSSDQENKTATFANSSEDNDMTLKFKIMQGVLMMAAANDADCSTYVDMALDSFTDEEIHELLGAPNWFDSVCEKMPGALPYKPWFEKLRTEIFAALQTDESSDSVAGNSIPGPAT